MYIEKQAILELNKNKIPLSDKEMIGFTEAFRSADQNVINIILENLRMFSPGAINYDDKENLSIRVNYITRTSYEQLIKLLRIEA